MSNDATNTNKFEHSVTDSAASSSLENSYLPEEPHPSKGWIALLFIAALGVYAGWFGPLQILLPDQAANITAELGGKKENLLALVTGVGALISMVANPIWGILSDRIRSRWGTRVPILIIGTLVAMVGLGILAFAATPPLMLTGWGLVQVGLNGPFAVLLAFVADRVPEAQRGTVGALFGVAQMLGVLTGVGIAVAVGDNRLGYLALIIAVPALAVPIAIIHKRGRDLPSTVEETSAFRLADLRLTKSFVGAFLMRFFMNLVNALMLLYLLYYLMERFGMENDPAQTMVLVLSAVYVLISAVAAAGGGIASDKMAKRKIWVVIAAIICVIGAVAFAYANNMVLLWIGVAGFAIGYGLFLSVDVGIITSALPSEKSRATMLGIANLASASPQALAPALAAPIVTGFGGYTGLYLVTAAAAVVALMFLPLIKTVR